MSTQWRLLVIALVAFALVACFASAAPARDGQDSSGNAAVSAGRASFSPAKLFDFANFKLLFDKTYSGFLEELVRKKYFLARAFRAFISAIKYKHRKSTYYLAVNDMSDWTRAEMDESRNEVLSDRVAMSSRKQRDGNAWKLDLPSGLPEEADEAERELKELAESSVASGSDGNVRDLPLSKLIHSGNEMHSTSAREGRKVKKTVASNNAHYQAPELASEGLIDEQVGVRVWELDPVDLISKWTLIDFKNTLAKSLDRAEDDDADDVEGQEELEDEVFLDLRGTHCFTPVRQQGNCGSCYAFAAVAMFEWMYCMETDELVAFSEQYIIDCGPPYVEGLKGCKGGQEYGSGHFVANFGLELRSHYPYNAQQNECPYEQDTQLESTGYIRFEFGDLTEILMAVWPYYLNFGPISIGMVWEPDFYEYGGGVFGWGCSQKAGAHAVIVVGHGREDGHEYWLIRNSHGANWGHQGYGKLAKAANCINPQVGYVYATSNGETIDLRVMENGRHDASVLQRGEQRDTVRRFNSSLIEGEE